MLQGMQPQELVQTIIEHASGKEDLIAPANGMKFSRNDMGQIRLDIGDHNLALTTTASRQMTGFLGIPSRFAQRLELQFPDLLVQNFNTILQKAEGRRMTRTLDGNARAILSDSYRRIDNELVFDGMYPVLDRLGAQIVAANISDDYMRIQAVMKMEGEIRKGDVVRYGVTISNSEVGKGALGVFPFLDRLVCTNGMILPDQIKKRAHIGGSYLNDDNGWIALSSATQKLKTRAMIAELAEYLETMASAEQFQKTLGVLREAGEQKLPADPTMVVESLAARYALSKTEGESALIALAESKDYSRWGLANAVTNIANTAGSYDRGIDLQTLGGKIMNFNQRDYNDLARMPKKGEVQEEEEVEVG